MTWKEFKEEAERLGIKDDDEIWYIDIHGGEKLRVKADAQLGKALSSNS
jgi:hypothetical protein